MHVSFILQVCSIFTVSFSVLMCLVCPSLCEDTPLSEEVSEAFEDAAAELQGSEVKLAVVDVTNEQDLVKELNVTDPPAIRLYLSGDKHNPVDCPGT